MKTLACLLLAAAGLASAADLQLRDGRTLKDYRVMSETPTTVTIRHAGGAVKLEKKQLPDDVLKLYPIDEAAAQREASEIAEGRAAYAAQVRAREEQLAREHAARAEKNQARSAKAEQIDAARAKGRREAELAAAREAGRQEVAAAAAARARQDALIAEHNERQAGKVSPALAQRIAAAVRARADMYFKTEYKQPASAFTVELQVQLEEPTAVPGWTDRYEVVGVAWWQAIESKRGFDARRSWFRAQVETKTGAPRVVSFEPLSGEPLR